MEFNYSPEELANLIPYVSEASFGDEYGDGFIAKFLNTFTSVTDLSLVNLSHFAWLQSIHPLRSVQTVLIQECTFKSDDEIRTLARILPNLYLIKINNCVYDENVFPNDRFEKYANGFGKVCLEAFGYRCSHIDKMSIDSFCRIDDETINSFLRKHESTLRHININGVNITDATFSNLCDCCSSINNVELSYLHLVSGSTFLLLKNLRLRRLSLPRMKSIEGSFFEQLFDHRYFPNLTKLNLSGNIAISNSVMTALANECPHLQNLNVSMNTSITVFGLLKVVNQCRGLKKLNVEGLNCVDKDVLELIGYKLTELRLLVLTLNESFTSGPSCILKLIQRLPRLRVVDTNRFYP